MGKNRTFLVVVTCLTIFLGFLLINQAVAGEEDITSGSSEMKPPPSDRFPKPSKLDVTGKEFVLKDGIFDLKLVSSEEVHIYLEAFPKLENGKPISAAGMVSIIIEPITTTIKTETQITITGLEIFRTDRENSIPPYCYQEGYPKEGFKVDSEGKCSFTQDISKSHHLWISKETSTLYVGNGKSSPYYDYDSETRTYTFKNDYTGTIVVTDDNIKIKGNGHTFRGRSDYGVYLYERTYVEVSSIALYNYTCGIYMYKSHWCHIYYTGTIRNGCGISLERRCHYNDIHNNFIWRNGTGIYFGYKGYDNEVYRNDIYSNGVGINYGYRAGIEKNDIFENNIRDNNNGLYLSSRYFPRFWHNNIYDNDNLNCCASTGEYAYLWNRHTNEGNFWGHTSPPGFRRYHTSNPDCNHWHTWDAYPYKVEDGWNIGYGPCEVFNRPPTCEVTYPKEVELTGDVTISFKVWDEDNNNVDVTIYIIDEGEKYSVGSSEFSNTKDGVTGSITFDATPYKDGYRIRIECDDGKGGACDDTSPITYTFVNDPPMIILKQPVPSVREKWGKRQTDPPTSKIEIKWEASDPEGDALEITISYRAYHGPWFAIGTDPLNTGSYEWDTEDVLDDLYLVRVEARERDTEEHLTGSAQSHIFFILDNLPLTITLYGPESDVINPTYDWDDETLLPFELSEPVKGLTIEIWDEDAFPEPRIICSIPAPSFYISSGIQAIKWDGKINGLFVPRYHRLYFRVKCYDRLGNEVTTSWSYEQGYVILVSERPVFTDLNDTPDPFWPPDNPTQISYTVGSPDEVITTLEIQDATGNWIATLVNGEPRYPGGNTEDPWYGPPGITENTIFKYILSGERPTAPLEERLAHPKHGVMRAIDSATTESTTSLDGNFIVYHKPEGSEITIIQDRYMCPDATYALWNVTLPESDAPLYPVSPFYDITPGVPPKAPDFPLVFALTYPEYLSPDYIKPFYYDPTTTPPSFNAVEQYIIDPANNTVFVKLDALGSIFVLMANRDITKPTIQDLVLTHQVLNFTLKDDLAGINIPSIQIILDGENITDQLIITGATGDLTVTVSGQDIFQPSGDTHTMTIIAQDRGGNEVRRTISFIAGYADVTLVLKPEALKVNPGVLTAYLKFSEPFGTPTTIEATLDGASQERWMIDPEGKPELGLERPIVVMKFRRADIEKALLDTEFILKGKFDDGTAPFGQLYDFEAKDSIMKIVE